MSQQAPETPQEIVIYPSRAKNAKTLALAALGMVAAVAYFYFIDPARTSARHGAISLIDAIPYSVLAGVGVAWSVLCLAATVYLIRQMVHRRPALVINALGIYDSASAVAVGLVRWEEIQHISCYRFNGQPFLGIVPVDARVIASRLGLFKRHVFNANMGLGAAPINIPEAAIPMTVEELHRQIREYLEKRGLAAPISDDV
jgi:hypothetical protein